jgi:hypothetical protein
MKILYYAYVGISSLVLNICYNKRYFTGWLPFSPTPVTSWLCVPLSANITIWMDDVNLKPSPPPAAVCPRFAKSGPTLRQDDQHTSPSVSTPSMARNCLGNGSRASPPHGEFPEYFLLFFFNHLGPFFLPPLPRFTKPGRQHTAMVFNTVCPSPPILDTPPNPSKTTSTPLFCPSAARLTAYPRKHNMTHNRSFTSESSSDVPPPSVPPPRQQQATHQQPQPPTQLQPTLTAFTPPQYSGHCFCRRCYQPPSTNHPNVHHCPHKNRTHTSPAHKFLDSCPQPVYCKQACPHQPDQNNLPG